jgi:hypothetical protein
MEVEMERILVEEMLRVLTHEHRMKIMRSIESKQNKRKEHYKAIMIVSVIDREEEEEKSN